MKRGRAQQGCLASDGDQRHRVHARVGQRRHEVGGAGPGGREAHARSPGDARNPLRDEASSSFVAHQYVANAPPVQRIV